MPVTAPDPRQWWHAVRARHAPLGADARPVDHAVLGGFLADRVGHAFVAGAQAAMRALVPTLPAEIVCAFCDAAFSPAVSFALCHCAKAWSSAAILM